MSDKQLSLFEDELFEDKKVETQKPKRKTKPPISISKISATSSATINLGNYNSARLEFTMEKVINDPSKIDIEEEKEKLWEEVNGEVDKQALLVKESLK